MAVTISGTDGFQGNLTGQASELAPNGINSRTLITDLNSNDAFLFFDTTDQTLKKVNWESMQPTGTVLQTVYAEDATYRTATGRMPASFTSAPLVTEGTEILTKTITPSSTSNKILMRCCIPIASSSTASNVSYAVFRGSTCIQFSTKYCRVASDDNSGSQYLEVLDSPNSTSTQTYSLRIGPTKSSYTVRLNGAGQLLWGGTAKITLTLQEIRGYP